MNKDRWFNLFVFVTMSVFLIGVIFSCERFNEHYWNNGHCQCGGNWAYEHQIGGPIFLYECDRCGRVYESKRRMR